MLDKAAVYDRFAELFFLKADIYNKQKNAQAEIDAIEAGLALDSLNYTGYYYFLAENHMLRGEYAKAQVAYKHYLGKDKKQQNALRARQQLKTVHLPSVPWLPVRKKRGKYSSRPTGISIGLPWT